MRLLLFFVWASLGCAWAQDPGFTLNDLDESEHTLADYRGRWVVINYWATWCPPCLEEMPELNHFQGRFGSMGATVLGINLEEIDHDLLRRFVDTLEITYPILLAGARPPRDMPTIRGLPTTHIVSPQGEIVETRLGPVTSALLEDLIKTNGGDLGETRGGQIVNEVCVKCFVSGHVQGVWYRGSAQSKARELNLRGYAKNLSDGRVEVLACGRPDAVEALVAWLAEGPPMAWVSGVERQADFVESAEEIVGFMVR